MDINRLTQKSQEALHEAQNIAVRHGHVEVDSEHLLLALCQQPEGLIPRLLDKLGRPADVVTAEVERRLNARPSVSGPGAEPGKIFISQRLNSVLADAETQAKRLKDEYVSVEHLILAMLSDNSPANTSGQLLRELGITRDRFLAALTEVRGHQRVQSNNPDRKSVV